MPTKHYVLPGRVIAVDANKKVMTVNFADPRPWTSASVTQFHITLEHGDSAQQFTLNSTALTAASTSNNRQLRPDSNEEITGTALGHLRCINYDATIGHYELTQPVTLSYGNMEQRFESIDFFVTDNTGNSNTLKTNVIDSVDRYDFAGDWLFDENNTNQAAVLTQTWGPTSEEVGGALDLPGDDWDLTGTALLVTDNTNYTWAETDDTSGTITGNTNSTWTRDGGTITILWGGNANTWYKVEIGDDLNDLVAVSDYNDIYTPGDVVWTKASGDFLSTSESTWTYSYDNGTITIKWEDDDDQKIVADWDAEANTFVWASENWSSGFGFQEGSPVLSYSDYVYNDVPVPFVVEIVSQFPYCCAKLTVDAHH